MLFNGECCDIVGWCFDQCENYFKFCVIVFGFLKICNFGFIEIKVFGDDDFSFFGVGGSLGMNL